jgi:hypothetical protein
MIEVSKPLTDRKRALFASTTYTTLVRTRDAARTEASRLQSIADRMEREIDEGDVDAPEQSELIAVDNDVATHRRIAQDALAEMERMKAAVDALDAAGSR